MWAGSLLFQKAAPYHCRISIPGTYGIQGGVKLLLFLRSRLTGGYFEEIKLPRLVAVLQFGRADTKEPDRVMVPDFIKKFTGSMIDCIRGIRGNGKCSLMGYRAEITVFNFDINHSRHLTGASESAAYGICKL